MGKLERSEVNKLKVTQPVQESAGIQTQLRSLAKPRLSEARGPPFNLEQVSELQDSTRQPISKRSSKTDISWLLHMLFSAEDPRELVTFPEQKSFPVSSGRKGP